MRLETKNPHKIAPGADETGRGTTLAMICCALVLFFYMRVGRAYLLLFLSPVYDTLTSITLILISLFTGGCALHMMFLGEVSGGGLREEVNKKAKTIRELAELVSKELQTREQRVCMHNGSLGSIAIRALSTTKRISLALDMRVRELNRILASPSTKNFTIAFELLRSPLETDSNCYTQLIIGDPIPPIEEEELLSTIRELFRDIDSSFARFARDVESVDFLAEGPLPSVQTLADQQREARRSTVH